MKIYCLSSFVLLSACSSLDLPAGEEVGEGISITAYSARLAELIDVDAKVQVLAGGFEWSEGPVWIDDGEAGYVLLSDVPENKIYRWSQANGLSVFMSPSGYSGSEGDFLREPGTNGLITSGRGYIIAADHGERGLSLIDLENQQKSEVISSYGRKPFNSPNDLVMADNGDIYFTDPPYGLKGLDDSPYKEQEFNGVYLLTAGTGVSVIDRSLTFPNGIGLSPDGRILYVANSDPLHPVWMKYNLNAQGQAVAGTVFYDASVPVAEGYEGLPDGLAVDYKGNLFASGPGGIYIFSPEAELLGRINTGRATANCTFGGLDGKTLFITADDLLLSVETRTQGQR